MNKGCILSVLIVLYCLLAACNSKEREYRQAVEYWNGREIVFPELTMKYLGRDTVCSGLLKGRYKILHYVDTNGCTSCRLRLFEWRQYVMELDSVMPEAGCVFVVGLKDFSEFELQQRINRFERPVLYDPELRLDSLNHLPVNPALQTFLLDSLNRVVALGDPVKNTAVRELYRKIVTGKE